jgi:hypothetical protein
MADATACRIVPVLFSDHRTVRSGLTNRLGCLNEVPPPALMQSRELCRRDLLNAGKLTSAVRQEEAVAICGGS